MSARSAALILSRAAAAPRASSRLFSTSPIAADRISKTITDDHGRIKEAQHGILNAKDNDEKERWQNQFVWQLARHSIAEELVVYPAFEKYLGDKGQSMADADRAEHQELKDKLYIFQNMAVTDENFDEQLKSLTDSLDMHIASEEGEDLPALDGAISEGDSETLSNSFDRYKVIVPSRSHPSAPDRPPWETAVGLMTAPLDHIGDFMRKFPGGTVSPNPSKK